MFLSPGVYKTLCLFQSENHGVIVYFADFSDTLQVLHNFLELFRKLRFAWNCMCQ